MYLLDADWIIQAMGDRQPAVQTLRRLAGSRIFVSYITFGEIYEGAFDSVNPDAHLAIFRHFLGAYHILTLNDPIMARFAELRAYLRRRGQLIPDFDLLIAASALHYESTLLTFNRRDFERIPDLKLYQ
ncbi:MAG: type II toxin-antitoxin system VapC family toxin [Candidatus Binatia bacterium]